MNRSLFFPGLFDDHPQVGGDRRIGEKINVSLQELLFRVKKVLTGKTFSKRLFIDISLVRLIFTRKSL
ncbi:MAG: hypothetical protein Q4G69_14655 [Planctomycetia bacterium]|nr:hypothetical protein [Planctomycetia bacterium]